MLAATTSTENPPFARPDARELPPPPKKGHPQFGTTKDALITGAFLRGGGRGGALTRTTNSPTIDSARLLVLLV